MKRTISLFIACVLILVTFAGCTQTKTVDSSVVDTGETIQSIQEDNVIDIISEDEWDYGDIEITTPYVTLRYSEKWLNYLKTEKNFKEESNVTFFACIDGKNIELFTVHFNEDGAMPIGVLNLESNSVYIAFSYADLKLDDTWTQNEKDIVNAMQEQINYIINRLKEEKNFVPEN